MQNSFLKFFSNIKERYGRQLLSFVKLLVLTIFFLIALKNFDPKIFISSIRSLPIQNFVFYLAAIFLSKILYAFRWKIVGGIVFHNENIPLKKYLQTNLLAEFVSIVMPTSIGGEITRILKLSQKDLKASYVTASILIDRILGIIGMVLVSLCALLLIGRKFTFNLKNLLPETYLRPIIIGFVVIFFSALFFFIRWASQPKQTSRITQAWKIIQGKFALLFIALGITLVGHLTFSLAHIFLFKYLFPVSYVEAVAIILTPQLARSIPISIFGISASEGLMLPSLMMAGMSREIALTITVLTLLGRYFFAFSGFIWEFLESGLSFFKQIKEKKSSP